MSGKDAGIIAGLVLAAGAVYLLLFKREEIEDFGKDYVPIPYVGSIEEYRDQLGDTINETLDDAEEVFTDYVSDLTDAWKERTDFDLRDLVTNVAGQTPIEEYRDQLGDTITKVQTVVNDYVKIPYVGSVEEFRETINKVVEVVKAPVKYLYQERYDIR